MSAGPPVEIHAYEPTWAARFEEERRLLEPILSPLLVGGIHHVGSTAVPGLAAKPVVDIMAGVRSLEDARSVFPQLAASSYCYFDHRREMHWFCKPSPSVRTYHLILVEPGGPWWQARLLFRDYLRAHADAAAEYESLKLESARRHSGDREAYTDAKAAFVEAIVALARAEAEAAPR